MFKNGITEKLEIISELPQIPEISVPEIPEFINPTDIPTTLINFSAPVLSSDLLQYFRQKSLKIPEFLGNSTPAAQMIQNQYYSYQTENYTAQTADNPPLEVTVYSNIEMDSQAFGSAVEKFIVDTNAGNGGAFV